MTVIVSNKDFKRKAIFTLTCSIGKTLFNFSIISLWFLQDHVHILKNILCVHSQLFIEYSLSAEKIYTHERDAVPGSVQWKNNSYPNEFKI